VQDKKIKEAMKAFDIAIKDMTRSLRSFYAVIFMFGVPLLVTGMFYFMFGNISNNDEFSLPRTQVIVANLDEGGHKFNIDAKNIPGGKEADTMGELIVGILQSDDLADLIELSTATDAESARAAVDKQEAQVAIIIPKDFSDQFADFDGEAIIEFYQDPTLTIGPSIIRAILNRFTDGMAGVKIAVNVFMDEAPKEDQVYTGEVVQRYLKISLAEADDIEKEVLDIRTPPAQNGSEKSNNTLLFMIGPIMGGMMIFYAFYTGTSTAESILREEEERTLPRLFTTPTSQATILSGKFMAVFFTVAMQVTVLIIASHLLFGIEWGKPLPVIISAIGIVFSASSCGIFINSFLKNTKQGGVVFGGVLTVTGMLGLISVFSQSTATTEYMKQTVSLLVPQGWAIRGLMQAMESDPLTGIIVNTLVLLVWSAVFFIVGVMRFNRRYA
jgi:ABC-2 type transport system permease protein